jgi:predicted metal-dependent hydrolase
MARPEDATDPQQLSLFDLPPASPAAGAASPPLSSSNPRPRAPLVPGDGGVHARSGTAPAVPEPAPVFAPRPSAVPPARPVSPSPATDLAPLTFRHPRADREVALGTHRVGYSLRRARRRSIGFVVSSDGLAVSAPRWVSIGEIESALRDKGAWILRKLHEQRERARRVEASRVEWRDGTSVPYLGETLILVLDPRVDGVRLNTAAEALPGVPRLTLHVGLPQAAEPEQIRDVVQSWLQRQATQVFTERCAHFAQALGVTVRSMRLSAAQTRWGSASADGSIRLNWRLIHFGLKIIDYVVAHELAHLREMNHSPAFWDVVRSVVPDYEQVRGALKDETVPTLG